MISAPMPVAQSIGRQADDGRAFGQQLRPQAVDGPVDDRLFQFGERADLRQPAALVDRVAQVDEHDDAGLRGHAEAGDEADPDGHAEIEAEQALEEHAADERARHGQHHQQRVDEVVVGHVEEHEDERDDDREDDR